MKLLRKLELIGGRPPPSHVFTSASTNVPLLEPIRICVGAGGVALPSSPTLMRMRCSMYVSGVVSGSMFTFIVRGPWSIGVPAPRVPRDARATRPVVEEPRVPSFASTERNRPA